jgi:hypothetical protein
MSVPRDYQQKPYVEYNLNTKRLLIRNNSKMFEGRSVLKGRTFVTFLWERKHSADGRGHGYLYLTTQQAAVFRLLKI